MFSDTPPPQAQIEARREHGHLALAAMERHLADSPFLVGPPVHDCDIALYAYTHVAAEGGSELAWHGALRAWLERVTAQPGHVLLTARGIPQPGNA